MTKEEVVRLQRIREVLFRAWEYRNWDTIDEGLELLDLLWRDQQTPESH